MVRLRAVVHIGSVKTGTTAFAAACAGAERDGTMPAGLLYPVGELWFDDNRKVVKHHQAALLARARSSRSEATGLVDQGVDDFRRTMAATSAAARLRAVDGSATVLMVAETLSHQKSPAGLTRILREYFDVIDYVLVARRQPRAVGSILVHAVKDISEPNSWRLDVASFLGSRVQARKFDYAGIVDVWNHDGAALHVFPFDESAPGSTIMTDAIFDRLSLPRLPITEKLSTRRTHASFSAKGLGELARIKRRHSALGWIPGADKRYRAAFSAAWVRHNGAARVGASEPWRLSAADEGIVAEAYVASNRRLCVQLGDEALSPSWREWFATVGVDVDAVRSEGDYS